jgi:hypothetical protein
MKKFTGGSGGGGGSQSELISMAMAEATKLFDKTGGQASGGKQEAANGAAMTVMKLLVQSKLSGMVGGGSSGGLSGLMSMVNNSPFRLQAELMISQGIQVRIMKSNLTL